MLLRIKDLREDHDLTQTNVAKILNCSQQTYSKYELGQLKIDIASLIKLADFYNVSLDYIVGTSDDKRKREKNNQ